MPTILPMGLLTIALSLALWGGMLWAYSGRSVRHLPYIALGLPLSAVVNLFVKAPIGEGVRKLAGIEPGLGLETPVWFLLLLFMLSPVFEELIKVLPALLPPVRRAIAGPDDAFWIGLALGIGFGVGEAAYLAWQIGASGAYEQYPWYSFGGFMGERLFVVFLHGLMTAIFLTLAARRKVLLGYLAAMGSHALLNASAMLYQLGLIPVWVSSAVLVVVLILGVLLFERIRPRTSAAATARAERVHYTRAL